MTQLPILLNGLEVGKVILHSKPTKAIEAAEDAAYHISSTNETQLSLFGDGSYGSKGRGGVALVVRRQWLPDGWTSDQTGTHPNGDFHKQAWSYTGTGVSGNLLMEGVGILECLHAANKIIARDLQALKSHNSTVTVRVTSDCLSMIRQIANGAAPNAKALQTVSPKLIKRTREEIQMLHGHGIQVTVELHWCKRNRVPQLQIADELARQAMRTGKGFSNDDEEIWSREIKSDMALDIESMVSGARSSDSSSSAHDPASKLLALGTGRSNGAKRRRARKIAQQTANTTSKSTGDLDTHPQFPLPAIPPPTKPGQNTPAVDYAGAAPPLDNPVSESSQDKPLPKESTAAKAVKRKAEDVEDIKEPSKRTKSSQVIEEEGNMTAGETGSPALSGTQHICTMPAMGGMDPETKVFSWDTPDGATRPRFNAPCPSARMVVLAMMEWRHERRMFLSTML